MASYTWAVNSSNNWNVPGAWLLLGTASTTMYPTGGDSVFIEAATYTTDTSPYTISVSDALTPTSAVTESAYAVTLNDAEATLLVPGVYSSTPPYAVTPDVLDLGGGPLTLDAGTVELEDGTLTGASVDLAGGALLLENGTLADATVDLAGGAFLSSPSSFGFLAGTLDNDVIDETNAVGGTFKVPGEFKVVTNLVVNPAGGTGPGSISITYTPGDEGQAGLDFLGTQTLNNVTITLGNFDSAYPSYIEADTATNAELTLTQGVTINVTGYANMLGWIVDDGTINVAKNSSLNMGSATLGGDAAITLTGTATTLTLSQTYLGTITGLVAGDKIAIAGLTGANVAAVNAQNQLVFYDAEGDVLDVVQFAPSIYLAVSFPITQTYGLGSGTEVTITPVPTGGGGNTFEWQQAQAVADQSSDFNTTANWLVGSAEPAAGPAAGSDVDFNNGGIAYMVTGYGVVAGLSVEADTVTFDGGLNVADTFTVQGAAIVGLQDGAFTLGGIAVVGGSDLLLQDGATVSVGASGIDVESSGILLLDGSVRLSSGPIALDGSTILVGAGAGAVDLTAPIVLNDDSFASGIAAELTLAGPITEGSGGGLSISGDVALTDGTNTYSGGTTILSGATLEVGATGAAGSGAITFATGSGETLKIDGGVRLANTNTIADFVAGDTIDLAGITGATSATDTGDELTVSYGTGQHITLTTDGSASGDNFGVAPDGSGGTDISIVPTFTWAGDNGDWDTAGNWTPTGVPGTAPDAGADVVISPSLAGPTILAGDPAYSVTDLTLGSELIDYGALTVAASMSIDGDLALYEDRGTSVIGTPGTPGTTITLSLTGDGALWVFGPLTVYGGMQQTGATRSVIQVAAAFSGDTANDTAVTWEIGANNAQVSFSGLVSGGGDTFDFIATQNPSADTLAFGAQGAAFTGTISNFHNADTIDLTQLAWNPAYTLAGTSGGAWTIGLGTATAFTFSDIAISDLATGPLGLTPDGSGGTDVTLVPTFTWAGGNGDWDTAGNWTPTGVPGTAPDAGADVVISPSLAGPTILADDPAYSVTDLTLGGELIDYGALTVAASMSIDGDLALYEDRGTSVIGTPGTPGTTITLSLTGDGALWVFGPLTVYGGMQQTGATRSVIQVAAAFSGDTANDTAVTWEIGANNAQVSFSGLVSGGGDTFEFVATQNPSADTLAFGAQGAAFTGTISNFHNADTIDLTQLAWNPAYTLAGTSGGAWTIGLGTATAFTFSDIAISDLATGPLGLTPDGSGGTDVTLVPTFTWAGGNGDWDTAGNWTPTGVPGTAPDAGADVVISPSLAGPTILADDPAYSVTDLTLGGELIDYGALTVAASMSIDGDLALYEDRGTSVIGTPGTPGTTITLSLTGDGALWVFGPLTVYGGMQQTGATRSVIQVAAAFSGDTANDTAVTWEIGANNAQVSFSGLVSGGGDTFEFVATQNPSADTLAFGAQGAAFTGTISNFHNADTIDLTQLAWNPAYTLAGTSGGAWTIGLGTATAFTFSDIATSSLATGSVIVAPDEGGGTELVFAPALAPVSWAAPGTSGSWPTGTNWSGGTAPNAGDNVTLGSGSGTNYAVTIATGTTEVANKVAIDTHATLAVSGALTINSGLTISTSFSLSGGPDLTVNSGLLLSKGTVTNSGYGAAILVENGADFIQQGSTLAVNSSASVTNTGPDTVPFSGFSIENGATLTNTDGSVLNQAGGTLTIDDSSLINEYYGASDTTGTVVNSGAGSLLINQDGGTLSNGAFLTNQDGATLTNNATLIESLGGSLLNTVPSTLNGTGLFEQTGGATENDGTFTQGTLDISGGLFTNNGGMTITGNVTITGAGALLSNSPIFVGGTLYADGNALIESDFTVAGNYIEGDATTLGQDGTLTAGTIEVTGNGHFALDGGTANGQNFDLTGGVFELQSGSFDLPLNAGETGTLQIDGGTTLEVSGTASSGITVNFDGVPAALTLDDPASFGGTFGGVGDGDAIHFASSNLSFVSYTVGAGGIGTLTLDVGGTDTTLQFTDGSAFNASDFTPGPGPGGVGTSLDVSCYRSGTRILTDRGEVPVELLRVGDLVHTVLGETAAPIIWIGQRNVDCARHPKPRKVWPVRVAAGAFGPGLPHTDLFLSPDHAVYVNAVLIPVRYLINGSTIVQVPVERVSYYHLELARHDVVLAQGLPAESFLDMKDGSNYANRPGPIRLYPDFAARMWEALGCARLIVTGPELVAVRALVERCAATRAAA